MVLGVGMSGLGWVPDRVRVGVTVRLGQGSFNEEMMKK